MSSNARNFANQVSNLITISTGGSNFVTPQVLSASMSLMEKDIVYSSGSPVSASIGTLWVDSSGANPMMKVWDGSSWDSLGSAPVPIITGIAPDNVSGSASTAIIINGQNFESGSIVKLIDSLGTELFALSIDFNNARSLQFLTPALTASAGPYDVKVINPDNQISILENALTVGQSPIWITPSGNLTTIFDRYNTGIISTLSATDPDGSNIIYSSNDIPSGLTLNANTGTITGDPADVSVSTTIPFSVNATDQQGSISQKSLNIIINPSKDGSSSNRAATSASQIIQTTGGGLSNGYYWIKPDGFSGIAKQIYCDMSNSGGGWMLMYWTGGNVIAGQGTSPTWLANTDTWNNDNGGANTILTNPTSTGAATVGNSFIDQLVQNYRNTGLVANLRLSNSPLNNFYFNADANSRYLPIAQREGRLPSSNAIDSSNRDNPGNSWWKTCKDSYLTSGQNGAGTPSGSTITYGGEFWGVYPFNMLNGYGGNFGSGIGTYWPDLLAGGHNNGWGQKVVLWLKTSIV
jgi:hypothetical protein